MVFIMGDQLYKLQYTRNGKPQTGTPNFQEPQLNPGSNDGDEEEEKENQS